VKILITGSRGVVGAKLVEVLLERGHLVVGVDLLHYIRTYPENSSERFEYHRADIGEYRQISGVIDAFEPDIVYNCAAEFGRWNGEGYYEQVWKSNVIGMKHIIRLQEKRGFRLVHCSSSEVYGDYEATMFEDVLQNHAIEQLNDYALSKRVNEIQIANSIKANSTESVLVRIFNTYGPGEWYHPFRSVNCIFTYRLLTGQPITVYSGHTRSSTYVDDCVNGLANIADNFYSGKVYNLACEDHHTIERLAELIVKEAGADPDLIQRSKHSEPMTTMHKRVRSTQAQQDLSFTATVSLEEGVHRTVAWMRKFYDL